MRVCAKVAQAHVRERGAAGGAGSRSSACVTVNKYYYMSHARPPSTRKTPRAAPGASDRLANRARVRGGRHIVSLAQRRPTAVARLAQKVFAAHARASERSGGDDKHLPHLPSAGCHRHCARTIIGKRSVRPSSGFGACA